MTPTRKVERKTAGKMTETEVEQHCALMSQCMTLKEKKPALEHEKMVARIHRESARDEEQAKIDFEKAQEKEKERRGMLETLKNVTGAAKEFQEKNLRPSIAADTTAGASGKDEAPVKGATATMTAEEKAAKKKLDLERKKANRKLKKEEEDRKDGWEMQKSKKSPGGKSRTSSSKASTSSKDQKPK